MTDAAPSRPGRRPDLPLLTDDYDGLSTHVECRLCARSFTSLGSHLARRHQMSAKSYREMFPGAGTVADNYRAWHRELWIDRTGQRPYWTPERIVRALQRWTQDHGRPPTAFEWGARRNLPDEKRVSATRQRRRQGVQARWQRWPTYGTVRAVFGSWGAALEAAGLPRKTTFDGRLDFRARWAKEAVAEALRTTAAALGRKPSWKDWEKATRHNPSSMYVRRLFGSWSAAVRAAGLDHLPSRRRGRSS